MAAPTSSGTTMLSTQRNTPGFAPIYRARCIRRPPKTRFHRTRILRASSLLPPHFLFTPLSTPLPGLILSSPAWRCRPNQGLIGHGQTRFLSLRGSFVHPSHILRTSFDDGFRLLPRRALFRKVRGFPARISVESKGIRCHRGRMIPTSAWFWPTKRTRPNIGFVLRGSFVELHRPPKRGQMQSDSNAL